jgi:phosphatidylserine/phosphatidylglycerophosphate/cardiolipin synthase-like enzyme
MVEEEPFGGGADSGYAVKALEAAGIDTRYGVSTFRYTHAKTVIIDDKRAVVIRANLTKSAFTRNREYLALVTSAAEVSEIQAIFNADWERRAFQPRVSSLVVSDVNSRQKLLELLVAARESLEVEAEVMADKEIRRALTEAQRRGVRVRVVMSPPEPEETTYAGLVELSGAGVGVRLVTNPYIHAKSILVDRERAYVGSINFTATSMDQNRELGLITTTPAAIQQLEAAFDADWSAGVPFHSES